MNIPEYIKAMNRAKAALLMNKEATFFTSVYFSLNQRWTKNVLPHGQMEKRLASIPISFSA